MTSRNPSDIFTRVTFIGAIALIFTSLGIWLAIKLAKPKTRTVVVEKEIYITKPTENATASLPGGSSAPWA